MVLDHPKSLTDLSGDVPSMQSTATWWQQDDLTLLVDSYCDLLASEILAKTHVKVGIYIYCVQILASEILRKIKTNPN